MSSHLSTFSESPIAAPALTISLISAATVFAEPPKVISSRYPRFKQDFNEDSVGFSSVQFSSVRQD